MKESMKVVVGGGGYAGALAAARLVQEPSVQVTVVAPGGTLVHRVCLDRLLARRPGTRTSHALTALLGPRVAIVSGWVERIDALERTVQTSAGTLPYDALIVATGSTSREPPGPSAYRGALVTPDEASLLRLRAMLPAFHAQRAAIVVVGGGPTAVELAATAAHDWPGLRVSIVSPAPPLASLGTEAQRCAFSRLQDLGVVWHEGAAVARSADGVRLDGGTEVAANAVVWAAGIDAHAGRLFPPGAVRSTREDGRIGVLPTLQLADHPAVFVVGDAAAVGGADGAVPMGCKTAMPMAAHAADNVLRLRRGDAPTPFTFRDTGTCVSIGGRWALGRVERGGRRAAVVLTGRLAGAVKATINAFVLASIRLQARGWLRYRWPHGTVFRLADPGALRDAGTPLLPGDR